MLTATATTTAATMRRGKKQRTGEAADEQASGPEQDLFGSPTEEEDAFTQARTQMEEELQRATGGSRFDPHPDEAKVRELRSGYARLFSEARCTFCAPPHLTTPRSKQERPRAARLGPPRRHA